MIVLPGYGETKTNVLAESYWLAKNGFNTLRFDYSDHVGESEGDICNTTLSKIKDDILSAVDYVCTLFRARKVGAVARSLASRALIRAASDDRRIELALNVASVVDVRKTLFEIYRDDHFARLYEGHSNGIMDVLGFQVDADNFLRAAIDDNFEDIRTTIEDIKKVHVPVVFFAAEKDAWVKLDDVRRVCDAAGHPGTDLRILPGAMHTVHENRTVAKHVLMETVRYSALYLCDKETVAPINPRRREIGRRIRKEKKRAKIIYSVTKEEERQFWRTYLEKYSFVINVHDYWNLLELIYQLLGQPRNGEKILDAGCGIGNFLKFVLVKRSYSNRWQGLGKDQGFFDIVGLDFVREALLKAAESQRQIEMEIVRSAGGNSILFPTNFLLADLDLGIPFKESSFDKVCANLVVSYLGEPGKAVEEMVRVLKPRGKIVVSSLKPFADLSQVYRNFVEVTENNQAITEAQKLLNNAGRIKLKESSGLYEFYSEEGLFNLLRRADVREIETFRSFGNQANVAVGTK